MTWGVVANMADKVAVMYAGKIVEMTSCMEIFKNPLHPYTIQLLAAKPKFDQKKEERLVPIDGMPPSLLDPPAGCAFAERCKYCMERCRKEQPELKTMGKRPSGKLLSGIKHEKQEGSGDYENKRSTPGMFGRM